MERRTALQTLAGMLTAAMFSGHGLAQDKEAKMTIRKPKPLREGDVVGLIAPASNAREDEEIRFATEVIESLGFRVKHGKHLFERHLYLAGSDEQRARDLNAMFADPETAGIMALRGGYGSPRILPYLDYEMISRNPKVLLGYSDITALLNALYRKSGLVTFHGPIARQTYSEYTLRAFRKVIHGASAGLILGTPPPFEEKPGQVEWENRITVFRGGKAEGRLIGGNLSLMTKLIGTPYEPDYRGAVLLLEDVNEEPYRVDGMLTHLWLAGRLQQLAGVALGKWTDCHSKSGNSFSLEEVFAHRLKPLGIPVSRGLMAGHVEDQATLPIGARVSFDAETGGVMLLESPFS